MTYPMSAKRLLEREYRRIDAWCSRRDAIYALFAAHYREQRKKL